MRELDLSEDTIEVPAITMNQEQCAEALGVSVRMVRSWTRAGKIPHCRLGGVLKYPTAAVEAWVADCTTGGHP